MNISKEEMDRANEMLNNLGSSLRDDKNRVAKAISAYVRNKIEDFHANYLSDEQMKELNPLIRNAIYTFLIDNPTIFQVGVSSTDERRCEEFVLHETLNFLKSQGFNDVIITEFVDLISDNIGLPLSDISQGCMILAGYEMFWVPKYWEDCIFSNSLSLAMKNK